MSPPQVLIVCVGVVASLATFGLLRYPHFRRAPYRRYGAFSLIVSALGAAGVFLVTVLMALAQGAS